MLKNRFSIKFITALVSVICLSGCFACTKSVRFTVVENEHQTYQDVEQYSYRCSTFRTCWATRNVVRSHIVPVKHDKLKTVCCDGYYEENGQCLPNCVLPCINGECLRPNTCLCARGYVRHPKNWNECIPKCTPECVNSDCREPNVCACKPGYRMIEEHTCGPICSSGCQNGTCVAPETCACSEGYELDGVNNCKPICNPSCINGYCIGPNKCLCDPGYVSSEKLGKAFECVPVCDGGCINGSSPSYTSNIDFDGTSPSYTSNIDFDTSFSSPSEVMEITSTEKSTLEIGKTTLIQSNTEVTLPPKIGLMKPDTHCQPKCINGICHDDNNCECLEGYEFFENSVTHCIPACDPICLNALCIAPNVCECYIGYEKDNSTEVHICSPFCEGACKYGKCIGNNKCRCLSGYEPAINDSNICEPICRPPCVNGFCISPNVCQCWEDFEPIDENDSSKCKAMCFLECRNGTCNQNGGCDCIDGFFYDAEAETCELDKANISSASGIQDKRIYKHKSRFPYELAAIGAAVVLSFIVGAILVFYYYEYRHGGVYAVREVTTFTNPTYGVED